MTESRSQGRMDKNKLARPARRSRSPIDTAGSRSFRSGEAVVGVDVADGAGGGPHGDAVGDGLVVTELHSP